MRLAGLPIVFLGVNTMGLYEPQNFAVFMNDMLGGMLKALGIFGLTLVFALPLGLIIAFGRLSKFKPVSIIAQVYIYVLRGTPLLLQLIFFYFGFLLMGIKIDRYVAAVLGFSLNYAAYFAEIYRGGIQSIPRGQYEAAHVLGLSSKQTFGKVILPQVIKNIFPPMGNEVITLVKDTALIYAIGIFEILKTAQSAMVTYVNFSPLVVAAVFYLVLTSLLTFLLNTAEKRFSYYK